MFPTSDRTERLGLLVDRSNHLLVKIDSRSPAWKTHTVCCRAERIYKAYRESYLADRAKTVFADDPL